MVIVIISPGLSFGDNIISFVRNIFHVGKYVRTCHQQLEHAEGTYMATQVTIDKSRLKTNSGTWE